MPAEEALRRLARRYLAAYGPAGPEDLAAWSGLPRAAVREAWEAVAGEVTEVAGGEQPVWLPNGRLGEVDEVRREAAAGQDPEVRLLPAFDALLLGYRRREVFVTAADGVELVRAHDVRETVQALRMTEAILAKRKP